MQMGHEQGWDDQQMAIIKEFVSIPSNPRKAGQKDGEKQNASIPPIDHHGLFATIRPWSPAAIELIHHVQIHQGSQSMQEQYDSKECSQKSMKLDDPIKSQSKDVPPKTSLANGKEDDQ
mmetsp:Transcript_34165/g.82818  ORF Transcript_34165/g.82818 Transcript_34165/m.82818 type:complete len:119 (-) Transcript_34165:1126-1482(-)